MLRTLIGLLLLLSACKTSMKDRRGPSDETPTTAQALAPNACASYFDPNAAPSVDPSTLVIPDAQVSAVRVDKSHALYMPKILAQADPNGDVIYYEACNPTTGCFDGVIRTPVADKPGWVGAYEYRLMPDAAPYQVSLQSCVRVDRVLDGTTGLVVRPTRFRDVELHCGPLYVGKNGGNLVYQQQPFPDSVLADKLHAMDAQDAVVDSKLEALFTAAQTYAKQNSLDSNQLAGIAATIGQERDSIYPPGQKLTHRSDFTSRTKQCGARGAFSCWCC